MYMVLAVAAAVVVAVVVVGFCNNENGLPDNPCTYVSSGDYNSTEMIRQKL